MKKTLLRVITIILMMSFAGCGGGDRDNAVIEVVNILSDQVFDGDITSDSITGDLSAPVFADESQSLLFGIIFDPLTGTEIQLRVEKVLLSSPFKRTARFYRMFREQQVSPKEILVRAQERAVPPPVREKTVRWRLKRGARRLWRKRNAQWSPPSLSRAD